MSAYSFTNIYFKLLSLKYVLIYINYAPLNTFILFFLSDLAIILTFLGNKWHAWGHIAGVGRGSIWNKICLAPKFVLYLHSSSFIKIQLFSFSRKIICHMFYVLGFVLTAKATKINYFVSGLKSLLLNILLLSFCIANFPSENHI